MSAMTAIRLAPAHDDLISFYDTVAAERDALSRFLARSRRGNVAQLITLLANHRQPVIFTGMGKSGHIAAKAAATFSSLGKSAFFINPAEAAHGDLGMVQHGSCVVMLSNSGSTEELLRLVPPMKARQCTLVGIVGRKASPLASACDHLLLAEVSAEADPLGMAPTSSTTTTLVMGDALAVALLQARGFTAEDFALSHPGGSLGKRLLLHVSDIMHKGDDIPRVSQSATVSEALLEMSKKGLGMTAIVDDQGKLLGIYTDGDLRRSLDKNIDVRHTSISEVMIKNCLTTGENELAASVVKIMDEKNINGLLVVDNDSKLIGAFNMHDILRAGIM